MSESHATGTSPFASGGEDLWAASHPHDPEWKPRQVLDIDVAVGIPSLPPPPSGRTFSGAWVLVRAFDEPLGSVQLTTGPEVDASTLVDSFPSGLTEAVTERLCKAGFPSGDLPLPLDGFAPSEPPAFLTEREALIRSGPDVTVVVCTRDQPEGLATCLESLQNQSYPCTEILVIDNAPTTGDAHDVVSDSSGPHPTTYVLEPIPGLSNARNRALAESGTDIVAWIDDDETADPHWVCELVRGFSLTPEATFVCGVMIPGQLDTPAQLWFEEYGGHSKGRGFTPTGVLSGECR